MSARLNPRVPAKPATTSLALACMVVWLAAAASTRLLGIWLAIGGAAVGLGGAVFVLDHAAARRSLQPSKRLAVVGIGSGCLMAAGT